MSFEPLIPALSELDGWLAQSEAQQVGVRAGCAKQIVWADGARKTSVAIVYIHGFSATGAEVRPLPDLVAQGLGANIYFARLTGHGQDGVAMGRARLPDWERDMDEALAIGAALGDDVILMGCSTGCTLITTALSRGARAKAAVFVSPNFGLTNKIGHAILQLPGIRRWGPVLVGRERSFEPISETHAALWTVKYSTQAVFTMADAVRAANASAAESITTPAYVALCETDQVVRPAFTRKIIARWGADVREDVLLQGPRDDKMGHVMAGDVFSPRQTAPLAKRIIDWAKSL